MKISFELCKEYETHPLQLPLTLTHSSLQYTCSVHRPSICMWQFFSLHPFIYVLYHTLTPPHLHHSTATSSLSVHPSSEDVTTFQLQQYQRVCQYGGWETVVWIYTTYMYTALLLLSSSPLPPSFSPPLLSILALVQTLMLSRFSTMALYLWISLPLILVALTS